MKVRKKHEYSRRVRRQRSIPFDRWLFYDDRWPGCDKNVDRVFRTPCISTSRENKFVFRNGKFSSDGIVGPCNGRIGSIVGGYRIFRVDRERIEVDLLEESVLLGPTLFSCGTKLRLSAVVREPDGDFIIPYGFFSFCSIQGRDRL